MYAHDRCLHPDDLGRFAALGVTAAMQPRRCSPDLVVGTWMENVGEERWDRAWRFRSLVESGAHVALSSDWQVGEMDPLVGFYSALTRAGLDGRDGWTPAERLDLDSAIRGYTREGAWAWHADDDLGVLRVGASADVVAWSDDLFRFEDDPAALLEQHAQLTIVGGEIVHDARSAAAGLVRRTDALLGGPLTATDVRADSSAGRPVDERPRVVRRLPPRRPPLTEACRREDRAGTRCAGHPVLEQV